jgi:hypothetical protein
MPKKNKQSKQSASKKDEHEEQGKHEEDNEEERVPEKIPDEFFKIINDFTQDISITFPEYSPIINKWWVSNADTTGLTDEEIYQKCAARLEEKETKTKKVFLHCLRVIPERFFDILYQNEKMFEEGSDINTEFLPGIVFKYLWTCDISQTTRATIWKYLQLLLFSIINSVKSSDDFGDTAKLFEAINENELKSKLEETLNHVQDMFNFSGQSDENENENNSQQTQGEGEGEGDGAGAGAGTPEMPTAENIQDHIQKMMQGKLGKFAMELAEETADELNLDMDNQASANDVFQKLFKNPGKLMSIVKNLGSKLDEKIKSGELKESELISESMEMLNNMKNMPGMNNMHEILSKMGMPGMAKGGKVNMNAMESQMQKNLKMAQMKERMKKKATAAPVQTQPNPTPKTNSAPGLTDEQLFTIFSKGDKVERTPRGARPPTTSVPVTAQVTAPTEDTTVPPVIKEKKKEKRKK